MNDDPPNPAKLALIRRFLEVNGMQAMIDAGTFLDHLALVEEIVTEAQAILRRGG